MRRFVHKLFNLSNRQSIAVIIAAAVLTVIALKMEINEYIEISCFTFSTYGLVTFVLLIVRNFRNFMAWVSKWRIWNTVRKLPLGERILDDAVFRAKLGLYFGAAANAVYVIVKLVTGLIYKSNWLEVLSVYYLMLTIIRYMIIAYERKNEIHTDIIGEWRRYRLCGIILLVMNMVLAVMVRLSVYHNAYFDYPGILIYIMALYAFYAVGYAIPSLISFRKHGSPLLSAIKVISLTAAMVSMLSLEIAMTARFGGDDIKFRKIMTSLTGSAVCIVVLAMAIYMFIHATKMINQQKKENQ